MVVFLYPVPQDYKESRRVKGQCYDMVRGEVVGVGVQSGWGGEGMARVRPALKE